MRFWIRGGLFLSKPCFCGILPSCHLKLPEPWKLQLHFAQVPIFPHFSHIPRSPKNSGMSKPEVSPLNFAFICTRTILRREDCATHPADSAWVESKFHGEPSNFCWGSGCLMFDEQRLFKLFKPTLFWQGSQEIYHCRPLSSTIIHYHPLSAVQVYPLVN